MNKNNTAYGLSKERSELEQKIGLDPNSYSNGVKAGQLQVLKDLLEELEKPSDVRQAKPSDGYERGYDHGYDQKQSEVRDLINQKIKSLEGK